MFVTIIVSIIILLAFIAAFVAIIDPYFHYHAPLENLSYRLTDERYVSGGIARHFEYDALIAGTSMTENFMTSECNELFGTNTIKIPLEGSSYNEINELVRIALGENEQLKLVFRGLDSAELVADKDERLYSENQWPAYLYDKNLINDIKYLLSAQAVKDAFYNCYMTVRNIPSTSFDEYANWNDEAIYGSEVALATYKRPVLSTVEYRLTEEERKMVLGNVQQNLTAVAAEYPNVTFYYFFTPASILYWDRLHQEGKLEWYIEAEKIAIEDMLKYPNIKLFSFCNYIDVVGDLSYYKDVGHYWEKTNSNMLRKMNAGEFMLTIDNYEEYIDSLYQLYGNYDYDAIFQ